MSFLQPAMLLALPVIALPIIIHLINQRRFQTVHWAAMQFLLAANRMSRGYARLRQWLILAARTLAIAGLIFAISRPLSSGWIGVAGGGRVDTTIILLDRSPSMTQIGPGGMSKLQSGLQQLAGSLGKLRSDHYVLIDSVNVEAREFGSPEELLETPETSPVSASADLPAMLESAEQYIRANRPSRCEVWICSDVRRHDWKDDSGRWDAIRASLVELPQMVRFHLLAYPDIASQNRSLRVTRARTIEGTDGPQLLLSFRMEQATPVEGRVTVPIQLELNGARSEISAEMTGTEIELVDHPVAIDAGDLRGWGRISTASDASPEDNEFYFVYDQEPDRRTVIVAEDDESVQPLEFAASISPDPEITCLTDTLSPDQLLGQPLDDVALILWQARLPASADPSFPILRAFLDRGGQVIFFPPKSPSENQFAGLSWGQWKATERLRVATWVGDQGLLTKTRSGAALPVGELTVSQYCTLVGDRTTLATLDGGDPLLVRALTDDGDLYFCTTTTSAAASSLAPSGVVLYAMIQRALEAGSASLGNTGQFIAGEVPDQDVSQWRQLSGNPDALSNTFPSVAGVYENGDKLLAINRSPAEDVATIVAADRVNALFDQLDFDRIDDQAGSGASLIQEVWRLFLVAMLIALIAEAALSIPRRSASMGATTTASATKRAEGVAA